MTTFNEITIGEVFFESLTGEYYIKKSEQTSWVFIIDEDHEYLDNDGQPIQCEFPFDHEVEDI